MFRQVLSVSQVIPNIAYNAALYANYVTRKYSLNLMTLSI